MDAYRKKLEDMAEFRRQMKLIEEKSQSNIKRNVELEEEVRRSSTIKSQYEQYKKQVSELKSQLFEQMRKADLFETEAKRWSEKYETLATEKEALELRSKVAKTDSKKRTSSQYAEDLLFRKGGGGGNVSNLSAELNDEIGLREQQLVKLETENKILLARLEESETLVRSQASFDSAQAKIAELETDNKSKNNRILELRAQLSADHNGGGGESSTELELQSLKSELHDYEVKVAQLESVVTKKDEELSEMDNRYVSNDTRVLQILMIIVFPTSGIESI